MSLGSLTLPASEHGDLLELILLYLLCFVHVFASKYTNKMLYE